MDGVGPPSIGGSLDVIVLESHSEQDQTLAQAPLPKRKRGAALNNPRKKRVVSEGDLNPQAPSGAPTKSPAKRKYKPRTSLDSSTSGAAAAAAESAAALQSDPPSAPGALLITKPKRARKAAAPILIPASAAALEGNSHDNTDCPIEATSLVPNTPAQPPGTHPVDPAPPRVRRGRPKKIVDPGAEREAKLKALTKPVKRPTKAKASIAKTKVTWKPIVASSIVSESAPDKRAIYDSSLKPRVWVSSKQELSYIIPEFSGAKSMNSIIWASTETPMLLLEDSISAEWGIDAQDQLRVVDLSITRSFVIKSTKPPEPLADTNVLGLQVQYPSETNHPPMRLIQDIKEEILDQAPDYLLRESSIYPNLNEEKAQRSILSISSLMLTDNEHIGPSLYADAGLPEPSFRLVPAKFEPDDRFITMPPSNDLHQGMQIDETAQNQQVDMTPSPSLDMLHLEYPEDTEILTNQPTEDQSSDAMQSLPFHEDLPPDIEALINAYINNEPIVLIIPGNKSPCSNHHEFPYIFLGFYQSIDFRHQETYRPNPVTNDFGKSGTVSWRFRLKWSLGGEYLFGHPCEVVDKPWWRVEAYNQPPQNLPEMAPTPTYRFRRAARLRDGGIVPEDAILPDIGMGYNCLFPAHLVRMQSELDSDETFSEGWLCSDCGLLNHRKNFRHYICLNPRCETQRNEPGYVLEIDQVRMPPEAMPLSAPQQCPMLSEDPFTSSDGMQVLNYSCDAYKFVKHIFTHNSSYLQDDATKLFHDIQRTVMLQYYNDSCFTSTIGFDFLKLGTPAASPLNPKAYLTVQGLRTLIATSSFNYGFVKLNAELNDISILAWPSPGSERIRRNIDATSDYIFMLCLGNPVMVTLRRQTKVVPPKSSKSSKRPQKRTVPANSNLTEVDMNLIAMNVDEEEPEPLDPRSDLAVSLVHGDILVLNGQNFELSLKRSFYTTIKAGQFDDAPGDAQAPTRDGHAYIDGEDLDWPDSSDDSLSDDSLDNEILDDVRAEDEDWENAERDFTKQYNRLRQHVAVRTGTAQAKQSSNGCGSVAVLPAVNHPQSRVLTSAKTSTTPHDKTTDQLEALSKYASRISRIDAPYSQHMGAGVNRKGPSSYANIKDKADRATTEQVLDPRTRIILFKMIGRGLIQEINGCISTGKEANVYHALTPDSTHLAVKIFKTSILVFKDRDRYVSGEFRFRRGYNRHNPRKMVRLWAEKEMRNLKRLVTAGIRCPEPAEVRENVLVMTFLGDSEGWPSPRLKDASLPEGSHQYLYEELVLVMRILYHQCKLVHADLSEYNILYHESHLYIIDVSQSVEHDHPSAFDFLRKTLSPGGEAADVLKDWLSQSDLNLDDDETDTTATRDDEQQIQLSKHEETIFLHSHIPRSLNEVLDPERDIAAVSKGAPGRLVYAKSLGVVNGRIDEEPSVVELEATAQSAEDQPDSTLSSEVSDEEESSSEEADKDRKPRGHRFEDREEKKVGTNKDVSLEYSSNFANRNAKKQLKLKPGNGAKQKRPRLRRKG
ncbi:hypothetical protein ONZ45_g13116 [Pleurotus djamor]|nr:hypothetical protein ONZ45_g13116 [Pleurotus djamor]